MPAVFGLGVRFRKPADADFTTRYVDDSEEQVKLLRRLRAEGFEAVPVALTWTVMDEPDSPQTGGQ